MTQTVSRTARILCTVTVVLTLAIGIHSQAAAHCDTLDGPVVEDARKALAAGDVTPVLKWVRPTDEKFVKNAFRKALAAQGGKRQHAEKNFFGTLVKIHRAGEGAPYTGLKPAGQIEPVIAAADRALADGSADGLVAMVNDAVAKGIRHRYDRVVEAFRHKDESVEKGREYVAAYVEYTHYVERLQLAAERTAAHHGGDRHREHAVKHSDKVDHGKHAGPHHEHGH